MCFLSEGPLLNNRLKSKTLKKKNLALCLNLNQFFLLNSFLWATQFTQFLAIKINNVPLDFKQ